MSRPSAIASSASSAPSGKRPAARHAQPGRLSRRLRRRLVAGYLLGVLAYLLQSLTTQTGLVGQLVAWQVRWLRYGSEKHAFLLALVLLTGPALWLGRDRGSSPVKLRPAKASLVRRLTHPLPRPSARKYWRNLLGLTTAVVVTGILGQWGQNHFVRRAASQPVYQLHPADAAVVPTGQRVWAVGTLQPRYQHITERLRYSALLDEITYVPLTPPTWRPAQPVRFVLRLHAADYHDPAVRQLVARLDQSAALPFAVTIPALVEQGELPTVVRQELVTRGLQLADGYCQLTYRSMHSSVQMLPRPPVCLLIGTSLAVLLLAGGSLLFLWLRNKRVFS